MTRPATSVLLGLLALACVPATGGAETSASSESESEGEVGDSDCVIASLGCACTQGGGCEAGLTCDAGVCVDLGEDESGDEGEEDTGACETLGCACDGSEGSCAAGLKCQGGVCVTNSCGNGALDANEVCDDGNGAEGDGCDNDCTRTEILDIVAGSSHTCALIERGRVRCWGYGVTGQLGYGATESVGDNESPADVGDLPLPPVVAISAGGLHTCAVIEDGGVRCWGFNGTGQLGYGNTETLGDDEGLAELGEVSLGGLTSGLALGAAHSCARIEGEARCWGLNGSGQLGLGNTAPVGDNEQPSSVAPIFLGGEVASLSAGGNSTCALLVGGAVRCWGENGSGQLGYGGTKDIGDDETPGNVVALSLIPAGQPEGTTVSRLSMALEYSCALLSSGAVLCWGNNDEAQLGQGNQDSWGDGPDELPSALEPIDLGTAAVGLATGYEHSCALLDSGALRCWGNNDTGQLGLGHEELIGDDEVPGDVGPVSLGRGVIDVTVGGAHTCVVLDNHRVMCWGSNQFGQLGYGFSHNVGDNELPTAAGTVDLL